MTREEVRCSTYLLMPATGLSVRCTFTKFQVTLALRWNWKFLPKKCNWMFWKFAFNKWRQFAWCLELALRGTSYIIKFPDVWWLKDEGGPGGNWLGKVENKDKRNLFLSFLNSKTTSVPSLSFSDCSGSCRSKSYYGKALMDKCYSWRGECCLFCYWGLIE